VWRRWGTALKLAVGVHVFRATPDVNEDELTRAREAAISNHALAATAQRMQLQVQHSGLKHDAEYGTAH